MRSGNPTACFIIVHEQYASFEFTRLLYANHSITK